PPPKPTGTRRRDGGTSGARRRVHRVMDAPQIANRPYGCPAGMRRSDPAGAAVPWLSVVIPAYDEERRLPPTLRAVLSHLRALGRPFEVIVADDGSADGTSRVAREAGPEVAGLQLPHRGKGAAVRDGVLRSRGGLALVVDADLSTPIEELDRLVGALAGGCAVAIGIRCGPDSRVEVPQRRLRRVTGRLFNVLVRALVL